jgi:enamine deaminase RidA (YjgF/YER057c/UK114 family)
MIDKLAAMERSLPPATDPPGPNRRSCVQVGNMLYLSGHGARLPELPGVKHRGKVGGDVSEQEAYHTARAVALTMLSTIKRHAGGLDRVDQVVRLLVLVNAAPGFIRASAVADGASDLFYELWGAERGRHARTAFGVAELTNMMVVEIQGEFALKQ